MEGTILDYHGIPKVTSALLDLLSQLITEEHLCPQAKYLACFYHTISVVDTLNYHSFEFRGAS